MTHHIKTVEAAAGKWRGILIELGLPENALKNKHGPCPLCDGVDRFRFDNKQGNGTSFCSQCGARDGMTLACDYLKQPFYEVAKQIDAIIGNIKHDPAAKPEMTEEKRVDLLRNNWKASEPMTAETLAHKYFQARGIDELSYPTSLRYCPDLRDGNGGIRPAILACVGASDSDGFNQMHRTFLNRHGTAKAEMESPRKMMPGGMTDGSSVRLSEYTGGPLGIAEGLESAMSASALFSMPVWASLTANMMSKWIPPEACDEIVIFGDNDKSFTGQAVAYALARRLIVLGKSVTVNIPERVGDDYNDVLMRSQIKRVV